MAKKWEDLVNRSIITQMASYPQRVLGNLVMKSIMMCSHFHFGIGNGWSSPPGRWCSILIYWHTKYLKTKSVISLFIPFHQNRGRILWYILMLLICTTNFELWASIMMYLFSSLSYRTHTISWNISNPLVETRNSEFTYCSAYFLRVAMVESTYWTSFVLWINSSWTVRWAKHVTLFRSWSRIYCAVLIAMHFETIKWANIPVLFLLSASATTLPLPGWYKIL